MNKLLAILAVIALVWVLFVGLSHAWMAMGVLKFAFIVLGVLGIGWLWGKFTK